MFEAEDSVFDAARPAEAGPGRCRLDQLCRLISADATATRMLGVTEPELIGQCLWDVFPALRGTDLQSRCLALVAGAGSQQFLFHYAPLDRWYVGSADPVGDAGEPSALDLRFTDVTDSAGGPVARIRAERLDAAAQATGRLCHDFNNCLTVLIGNAEYLEEVLGDQPEFAEAARLIFEAGERAAALTARVLRFARRTTGKAGDVEMAALLRRLAASLRERSPGSRIDVSVQTGLPPALAAAAELEDALRELALNGLEAMAGGGTLRIAAFTAPDDGHIRITVADTGPGIDPAIIGRCMEPFVTKASHWGAGLGLSSAYGFAAANGGMLQLESHPGRGTCAVLDLPAGAIPTVEAGPDAPGPPAVAGHVLLVDDDAAGRSVIARQLAALGYSVTAVASAAEALRVLADGPPPLLLLADLILPGGMDGANLVEAARKTRPTLPALLMSGYAAFREGEITREGGVRMLPKPFRRAELERALIEETTAENGTDPFLNL
jgi:signal transduction histidine kinase/CheY-like chemotaxis protein